MGRSAHESAVAGRVDYPPAEFTGEEVRGWTDTASLPLLPTEQSLEVFVQLRKAPRLDLVDTNSWRARPHTELHATNDKGLMDLKSESRPRGFWPVFAGESFDIWVPDTGRYYAWANLHEVVEHLQAKRLRGQRLTTSPYFEFQHEKPDAWWRNKNTLPCYQPRVVPRIHPHPSPGIDAGRIAAATRNSKPNARPTDNQRLERESWATEDLNYGKGTTRQGVLQIHPRWWRAD